MAYIQRPNSVGWSVVREVKNLGWLLRNWKDVQRITVEPLETPLGGEARLTCYLNNGQRYLTDFASRCVLRRFLDRPVFRGLVVTWDSKLYVIGADDYRAMRERWEE